MSPSKSSKVSEKKSEHKENPLGKIIFSLLGILIICAFVWTLNEYIHTKKELNSLAQTVKAQEVIQDETQRLLSNVRKHVLVPSEVPSIETISDAQSFQKNPFYAEARDGQKILTYSHKVVLYDPIQDIVINMGSPSQEVVSEEEMLTLEIRNGSKVIGVAQTMSTNLDENKYDVLEVTNAAHREYKGNTIVNINNKDVEELAAQLKASITDTLPEKEKESEADVIIILGNEK